MDPPPVSCETGARTATPSPVLLERENVQHSRPDAFEAALGDSALDGDLHAAETTGEPGVSPLHKLRQVPPVAAEDVARWFG